MQNPTLKRASALGTALVLSLAVAGIASAKTDKGDSFDVVSGKSVITPDNDLNEALLSYGVTVTPVEGAKANNHGVVFPITGGVVKAPGPTGTIEHSGGFMFTNSNTGATLTVDDFLVKLGHKKAKLFVTSGTDAFRFLTLDISGATVSGSQGADLKIKNVAATLAKPGAEALSEVVGVPVNKGGDFGTLKLKALTQDQN